MASLGLLALLAAFVVASYAATISVVGARRRSTPLIDSGVGAQSLVSALLVLASTVLISAFVSQDYSIKYVASNSDAAQPLFYRVTAFWGGLDGSILFWAVLLSISAVVAIRVNRETQRELIPYVVAIVASVEMFFIFLMIVHNNPFDTFLAEVPADGRGMNPLLQTPLMVIHPPALYTGFVGMTIPFAFGLAALITGHLDDSWLLAVRRWTMIGWLFLSFGLTLGMIWAYEELGWGGYWGWDPVENAGLLPWFTATAFLHSLMVQERRGMLRVWNVTLVILTFLLTIFGTFMTRSGVVQSVHAFGEDKELAWLFTAFMIVASAISFGFVIYRLPLLRARHELDSWVSREAAFLVNNWILLFSAVFVLFATLFPTLSEVLMGQRLTVGPPFFNTWMLPIGLMLLTLTGIGPLLAWRKSTLVNLREQFLFPVGLGVVTAGAMAAFGVQFWASGLCFALCAFVTGTMTQEFFRGARVRQRLTGTDLFTALIGLFARQRRRYAGYIVHLGIVLMFLGFAGEGFKREEQVLLAPGQDVSVGRFAVKHEALTVTDDGQKQMITARLVGHPERRDAGRDVAGEVVLPQARERPDHRGRHPPRPGRGPLHRARRLRRRTAVGYAARRRQPARQLDLVRLRRAGVRDHHRAAAGEGVRRGAGPRARRRGHLGAGDPAARRGCLARARAAPGRRQRGFRGAADAARARPAEGDHLHVPRLRPPAAQRVHLRPGRQDAERAGGADRTGQEPRPGLPVLHRPVGESGTAGQPDRQGLQPPRVGVPVRRWPAGPRRRDRDCGPLVALRRAGPGRGARHPGRSRPRAAPLR